MPAAEPHPRRRRALRRALVTIAASGALVLAVSPGPSAMAQIIPSTTTEPAPTTTEADPVETTTTTEVEPAPTTTEGTTETTRSTTQTTQGTVEDDTDSGAGDAGDDDGVVADDRDVLTDDEVREDEGGVVDDVPLETTSTARDLLVSGDGTEGAEDTTTTSTTVVEVAADGGSMDEETQIWLIVAGLVVVAALIGVWTWRYWVRTRPEPVEAEPDPTTVFHGS